MGRRLTTSLAGSLAGFVAALLLPIAAVVAIPSPAYAATYCYTVIPFDPSGWLYGAGIVDNCIQPVQAEIHLREDRFLQPDREVSNDIRPNVTSAFMEARAFNCLWTPGTWYDYFLETRVKVNNSYQQKVQSNRYSIQYYCY